MRTSLPAKMAGSQGAYPTLEALGKPPLPTACLVQTWTAFAALGKLSGAALCLPRHAGLTHRTSKMPCAALRQKPLGF